MSRARTGDAAPAAPPGPVPTPRSAGSALAPRNWRVASRLIVLVAIPTLLGLAVTGLRVSDGARSSAAYGQVSRLAVLDQQVLGLAQAMEDERAGTAAFIAAGRPAAGLPALHRQYVITDGWAATVRRAVRQAGRDGYPARTRASVVTVQASIADLPGLRRQAAQSQAPALAVISGYSVATAGLFPVNDGIADLSGDSGLIASVRAIGSLSRMADQASLQQAILGVALAGGRFEPGAHAALLTAQAQQAADLASFRSSATSEESWALTQTLASPPAVQAQAVEQHATASGDGALALGPDASQQWGTGMSFTVGWMRHAEQQMASWVTGYAQASQRSAMRAAMITGAAALAVLALVLLVTLIVARSMVRPLRRLEAAALDVAGARLPAEVRALDVAGNSGPPFPAAPADVPSTDEIGQVARAFDRMHREALRLAGEEARRRRSVSVISASFFRRSHSLLERLLRLIDSLERSEDDPGRLASLFQIDHLVTRMRRNSDSALVLAGHERSGDWTDTVTLVDVLRAAVSEIEQYNRVVLDVQHGDWVSGAAVADTVHLLAELLENATAYSPKTTQVIVSGHAMRGGGLLITITDAGPGMPEEFLAQINWQLANPPTADLALTRHMGLFVVAHLAARHSIEVALEMPPDGGTTAEVYLPATLVSPDAQEPESAPRPQISAPMPQPEGAQLEGAQLEGAQPRGALPIFDSVESDYPGALSGLPQRIPQARPASGASADQAARPAEAAESAETTRGQVAGFQRGSRRARAVVSTDRTRQPERDR